MTNINYVSATNTTSITNNAYCETLTCGNINTSYLSTLTSNVQTQLNSISIPTNTVTTDTVQTITGAKTFSTDINTTGNILQNGFKLLPVGTVLMYAGSSPPTLFVNCTGQSYDRVQFADLFAVCGTTYGFTSSTTFNIPDMRSLFVRGAGTNNDPKFKDSAILGRTQTSTVASHSHDFTAISQTGLTTSDALYYVELLDMVSGYLNKLFKRFTDPIVNFTNYKTFATYDNAGISITSTETRPNNISMTYMIKIR